MPLPLGEVARASGSERVSDFRRKSEKAGYLPCKYPVALSVMLSHDSSPIGGSQELRFIDSLEPPAFWPEARFVLEVLCGNLCGGGADDPIRLDLSVRSVFGMGASGKFGKPVALLTLQIFRKCEFLESAKPSFYIGTNVFFKLNLYKVYGFQWTNQEICCIIISFLCRGLKAVIFRKR